MSCSTSKNVTHVPYSAVLIATPVDDFAIDGRFCHETLAAIENKNTLNPGI
jgi:hypothetical protein